ncbi:MAG TPA: dihydrofolate reductase family protein [Puia sp.]|nr:dihydrofolate reductase family protein [Puia sp.]
MRNLIYGINLTIDGCCDHTKVNGSEEIHEYWTQRMRDVDTIVYGRKIYELMVPYWPDVAKNRSGQTAAANEFARTFDAKKIVVFSKTLEMAERKNTRIVRGNLRDEIEKLKQEEGKNISLSGLDLASQVIALGLVDEYYMVVHPIVAGEGRRLMEGIGLQEKLQLRLVESSVLGSGCVALHYLKQA